MNEKLKKIIEKLKERKELPKNIQLTRVGRYFFANLYNFKNGNAISESVSCGFDENAEFAMLKAFSEYAESKAFKNGRRMGYAPCQTERSDGFAAFPKDSNGVQHIWNAKKNAYNEALERFVWANWWDNQDVKHTVKDILDAKLTEYQKNFLVEIKINCDVNRFILLSPQFKSNNGEQLFILIGFLNGGGVISGGACGEDFTKTLNRSLSEIFRHGLAVKRMREGVIPKTFYEKRLSYFSTVCGQKQVEERLSKEGKSTINLPETHIDEEIPHSLSDLFYVHRFLFINQPPFIGGKLERFCI